jgi:hypothetical protein
VAQFCAQYAGVSRSLADELIRNLEEFGPAYFHLAGVTKITPEAFRLIAPAVSAEGVQCGDERVPFTPENAARIAAAVEELRTRATWPSRRKVGRRVRIVRDYLPARGET